MNEAREKRELEQIKPAKILKGMPEYFELDAETEIEPDSGPQYVMMNLETDCPYRCLKCAEPGADRKMGEPLTLVERRDILRKMKKIGVKELVIVGAGEPSTGKNFKNLVAPVIESASENGMGTVLFTTGFGINRAQAEFYRDHDTTVFISLDSLDPKTYKYLTGGKGNLKKVLENIKVLRETYKDAQQTLPDGRRLIRLGINATVQKENIGELDKIKEFAGDDMIFIANEIMPQGKGRELVQISGLGDKENETMEELKRLAAEKSETGGHSSLADGMCSYFNRGVTVDTDGELLSCAYASETAHHYGNVRDGFSPKDFLQHYQERRGGYEEWCKKIGRMPTCPVRDTLYQDFVNSSEKEK
ncbi:MAG: radical SAM protein [Candidatus Staskawiczbacteria bacterium]